MVKLAAKSAEKTRVHVRSVRQSALKDLKKDTKSGVSADERRRLEKQVALLCD